MEGDVDCPPESVKKEYLDDRGTDYECPWKGHADCYDIIVGDRVNSDAASSYPDSKRAARQIKEHGAFERSAGMKIER